MENRMERYDFVHKGLMKASTESIPIGNGDLGANVWVCENGIMLLLSKTDNWSEQYRLLKTGLVRLSFSPSPFGADAVTRLRTGEGCLEITSGDGKAKALIYTDASYPVYRAEFTSDEDFTVTAEAVNYRSEPKKVNRSDESAYFMNYCDVDLDESADVNYIENKSTVVQYHRNGCSCYDYSLILQGLESFPGRRDPLINLTFGFAMNSERMTAANERTLTSQPEKSICINIFSLTKQCAEVEKWKYDMLKLIGGYRPEDAFEKHRAYWKSEWERSYVHLWGGEEAETISRGCNLQRYMNLCAGRGAFPIKFNGSIFAMEPSKYTDGYDDYDYRLWGAPYWFQNTRLIYWHMLYSGDFETVLPFFKMYLDMLPIAEYRSREYFGHGGALIPETVSFFGLYANSNYGKRRDDLHKSAVDNEYIRWYYQGTLELAFMMLQYSRFNPTPGFNEEYLYPFSESALRFFRLHFKTLDGRLLIKPTSALETWQDCVNDTPTVSGIKAVCEGLFEESMPPESLKTLCGDLLSILPDVPVHEKKGVACVAPFGANLDPKRRNAENPELYAVFPYLLYTADKNAEIALNTYKTRDVVRLQGWAQDAIQAALLGLGDDVYEIVLDRFSKINPKCIFPAFWGPNYDWTPDQDHGSVAAAALVLALLQSDGGKVKLFPALKNGVNAAFRLPVRGGGYIECKREDGVVTVISNTSAIGV